MNTLLLQLQTETMGLFVLIIITILEYKSWSMQEGRKIAAVGPYDLISLWGFKQEQPLRLPQSFLCSRRHLASPLPCTAVLLLTPSVPAVPEPSTALCISNQKCW